MSGLFFHLSVSARGVTEPSAAAAAAEEDEKRDDDYPYALVVENIAKTVIHSSSLSPPFCSFSVPATAKGGTDAAM